MRGELAVEVLPLITVVEGGDGTLVSLNNRRLYVLKKLREAGALKNNEVKVRLKPALARELERYTKDRCSLKATIMLERSGDGGSREGDAGETVTSLTGFLGSDVSENASEVGAVARVTSAVEAVELDVKIEESTIETVFDETSGTKSSKSKKKGCALVHDDTGPGVDTKRKEGGGGKKGQVQQAELPAKVVKAWKGLQRNAEKGNPKKVIAFLDDMEAGGLISSGQRDFVLGELGVQE